MKISHVSRSLLSLVSCCLFLALAACSAGNYPAATSTHASARGAFVNTFTSASSSYISSAEQEMIAIPQVQTSCPPVGKARAAILPPLASGTHQNIVYLVREFGAVRADTLKRYDVATGRKTEVLKLFSTIISAPQVSADDQWILFHVESVTPVRRELRPKCSRG